MGLTKPGPVPILWDTPRAGAAPGWGWDGIQWRAPGQAIAEAGFISGQAALSAHAKQGWENNFVAPGHVTMQC